MCEFVVVLISLGRSDVEQYRMYMTAHEWYTISHRKQSRIISEGDISAEIVYDGATCHVYMRPHKYNKNTIDTVNKYMPYRVAWRNDI